MENLDIIQAIFWCLTYVFLLFYQLWKKEQIIPSLVVIQNLSWEFNSVLFSRFFNYALLFRFLWLMLDFAIFMTILKMTIKASALKQIRALLFLTVYLCGFWWFHVHISSHILQTGTFTLCIVWFQHWISLSALSVLFW